MDIGLDIDGVLVTCNTGHLLRWLEHTVGLPGVFDRFVADNNWERATGLPSQEITKLYRQFELSADYPGTKPIAGAQNAIRVLQRWYRLHALTARPTTIRDRTLSLLAEHFGSQAFVSHHFDGTPTKRKLVGSSGVRVLIEDNYAQAMAVGELTKVILFPSPFNVHLPRNGRCLYLEAGRQAYQDMIEEEWDKVRAAAWAEISHRMAEII